MLNTTVCKATKLPNLRYQYHEANKQKNNPQSSIYVYCLSFVNKSNFAPKEHFLANSKRLQKVYNLINVNILSRLLLPVYLFSFFTCPFFSVFLFIPLVRSFNVSSYKQRKMGGRGSKREKKKRERRKIIRNEIPFDPDVKQSLKPHQILEITCNCK